MWGCGIGQGYILPTIIIDLSIVFLGQESSCGLGASYPVLQYRLGPSPLHGAALKTRNQTTMSEDIENNAVQRQLAIMQQLLNTHLEIMKLQANNNAQLASIPDTG